jgi:protein kinase
MDKYKVSETLGTGSYGSVYKAEDKETGEFVAIKKMKKKYTNWDECKNLREVKSLNLIKHENIIKIKEMIREDDMLHLVFEYMESNLFDLMQKKAIKRFSENEIKNIIWQLVKGIAHMHKYGFFHRDLKPENILVKNETNIKLADFGLAREIRSIPPYTEYVSTRWYRAPECLLSSNNYNSQIDIWAIGAIMSELFCGKPLFPGNNIKDMLLKICRIIGPPTAATWTEGLKMSKKVDFKFPNSANLINFSSGNNNENSPNGLKLDISYSLRGIVKEASDDAIKFMEDILKWDPNKRPTAGELLEHPFLKGYTGIKDRVRENFVMESVGMNKVKDRADSGVKSRIGSRKNWNIEEKKTPDINKSKKMFCISIFNNLNF